MSESLGGRGEEAKKETLSQFSEAAEQVRAVHIRQQSGGSRVNVGEWSV